MGTIRILTDGDRPRLAELLRLSWASTRMVSCGRLFDILDMPGFVAVEHEEWLGYATYDIDGESLEVNALESIVPGRGAGAALVAACVDVAEAREMGRIWLVTTNDNLRALRFYQRRGWVMAALRPGAVDRARRTLKPEIPAIGLEGIPIRDELELELPRTEWQRFVEQYRWPTS